MIFLEAYGVYTCEGALQAGLSTTAGRAVGVPMFNRALSTRALMENLGLSRLKGHCLHARALVRDEPTELAPSRCRTPGPLWKPVENKTQTA
jgi:hypothetical protein